MGAFDAVFGARFNLAYGVKNGLVNLSDWVACKSFVFQIGAVCDETNPFVSRGEIGRNGLFYL